MKQGKEIQRSPLPHTLAGPTAPDGRRENLQGATLSDYKKHSRGRACSPLRFIRQQTTEYLTGLGHCSIPWAAWARWDLRQGEEGHRPVAHGAGGAGAAPPPPRPFAPQSGQPSVPLPQPAGPQRSIPRKNSSNFPFKNPHTGAAGLAEEREKTFSLSSVLPQPLSFASLPFFCSALFYLSQAASRRVGRE